MLDDPDAPTIQEITDLAEALAHAEACGDVEFLEDALEGDFVLIGPYGFVLDRQQYLVRHTSGDLVYDDLVRGEVAVRVHGDAAMAVCRDAQRARYRGREADGRFRTTLFFVRDPDRWRLAGEHLSPLADGAALPAS